MVGEPHALLGPVVSERVVAISSLNIKEAVKRIPRHCREHGGGL